MAGAQVPSSVTILNSLKGFQAISLTEFATSALSQIAAGSVVEIAGAFFNFPADETINASTWTSITSGNTAYIVLVPAGTAGSQTVTAEFTATAPVWRDDNQGWYASAASVSRVIGSVYKVSATAQTLKYLYSPLQNGKQKDISVVTASVASSISVGGNARVFGYFNAEKGLAVNNFVHKTSPTKDELFTAISPYIPVTGDSVIVNGTIQQSANNLHYPSFATRTSSTIITLYTCFLNIGSNAGISSTITFISGSASTFSAITLAW